MNHEDTESSLLVLATASLCRTCNVLFQFFHRILQGCSCIVHLIDNKHVLPDQVRHLQTRQVEPLRSSDFCAWLLDRAIFGAEGLVKGEADGLDGNIGRIGLLQEGTVLALISVPTV